MYVLLHAELKNFVAYCVFVAKLGFIYIVLHDFNLTYYFSIILGSLAPYIIPKIMLVYRPHPYL